MILIENPERFAEFQEVEGYNLLSMTGNGWVIVAILNYADVETQQVNTPYQDSNGYHQTQYTDQAFVTNKPRYLLGKTRDTVLEELRADNKGLKDTADHHKSSHDAAVKRAEDLKTELESTRSESESRHERANKLYEDKKAADKRCRNMEGDLGKLRQAVGDIKFKEIVEADVG